MSYIVPRDKPSRCTNCPFMDRITYDCKLMYGYDYSDFKTQYKNCPLVEIPTPHGDLVDLSDVVHPNDSMRRMTIDEQLRRTCEGWSADRKQYVIIEAGGETDA